MEPAERLRNSERHPAAVECRPALLRFTETLTNTPHASKADNREGISTPLTRGYYEGGSRTEEEST